jgi:hypothetical protein
MFCWPNTFPPGHALGLAARDKSPSPSAIGLGARHAASIDSLAERRTSRQQRWRIAGNRKVLTPLNVVFNCRVFQRQLA